MYIQTSKNAGTQAEKYLRNLTEQNAQFGKSTAELAKNAAGWKLLHADQKKATVEAIKLSESIALISKHTQPTLTALETYKQKLPKQFINCMQKASWH
jgi:hypothetical protein